jgi:hypothetical protein
LKWCKKLGFEQGEGEEWIGNIQKIIQTEGGYKIKTIANKKSSQKNRTKNRRKNRTKNRTKKI